MLLPARQFVGAPAAVAGEIDELEQLVDATAPLVGRQPPEPERHVPGDVEVREQRALLGYETDAPPFRRDV